MLEGSQAIFVFGTLTFGGLPTARTSPLNLVHHLHLKNQLKKINKKEKITKTLETKY